MSGVHRNALDVPAQLSSEVDVDRGLHHHRDVRADQHGQVVHHSARDYDAIRDFDADHTDCVEGYA